MLCFSLVLWLCWLAQLLKTGGCRGSAGQDVAKICTTLWPESDSEVKSVKAGSVGALIEV